MKKKSTQKAPAASALPRKKKPVAGRVAQGARKSTSTKGRRKTAREEHGIEENRGRAIPFIRTISGGTTVTGYGIGQDSDGDDKAIYGKAVRNSWLLKVDDGTKTRWLSIGEERRLLKGDAARRQLAGIWYHDETWRQWLAIESVTLHPLEFYDFKSPQSAGKYLCDLLHAAILSGNRHQLDRLSKVIEAFHAQSKKETKRRRVARAVGDAARKHGRIPTANEALQCFIKLNGDDDEKNFRAALKDCGFDWLIVRS